ncbi:MAG: twin-arginine translocation signal domain-containing protein [Candidatus Anammoximicrobium sp.]|nr:twin-arginine translocation signal domain-containing protein [Candidatus Anammoximicrobium sp.]
MSSSTTRRAFLRTAAAASGCLAIPEWLAAQPADQPAGSSTEPRATGGPAVADAGPATALNSPVLVVTQAVSRDVNPRSGAWCYLGEVLGRAGVFFEELPPDRLPWLLRRPQAIVLLAGDVPLTADQRQILATWVGNGGSLVGIGGTSGLDEVFGVTDARRLAEGWIKVTAQDHPLTAGLRSSLHVFGGCTVKPGSATPLAGLESGLGASKGSAILEHRVGAGRAILLAPDLLFSIVHIQQGLPVFQDVRVAPDGTAATNEGILKAEDGMVLDWTRDRTPMEPDKVPVFLEPIADELRELILRSVFHAAREQGIRLPLLWSWPRGLPAVGHISHDSDGNDPVKAAALLEVMNRCQIKSTWCMLYPGGYPREFYRTLQEQGYEVALHYDALGGGPQTSWSKDNFLFQRQWLLQEAGLKQVHSNKSHYTRWEGRLDFWRWCEEAGLHSDQTRGPSKQGTIGFALGGSQPYFPLDDEADTPRMFKVLEVNLQTQDLVVVCPAEYGRQLLDSALRHHGVAHFLFHPAHIQKPKVADALCGLVDYGRTQGLEWWTNEQIYQWEISRRSVAATFDSGSAFTLNAANPLREATLLFLAPAAKSGAVRIANQAAATRPWQLYGFDFEAVTLDLAGQVPVQIG